MEDLALHKLTPKKEDEAYSEGEEYRFSATWVSAFLAALRESGNVRFSCETAGIARTTAYDARKLHPDFAKLWDVALDDACDQLELVARARAVEQSDTLMIFLLKAHRPEKYRERYDINMKVRKPPKPLEEMTDAELDEWDRQVNG